MSSAKSIDTEEQQNQHANYVLVILFVVMTLNFLDRQIITVLAESIKQDMGLSDKQIGLMTGLSFALFYTTLSIPIAMLADRWNRSRIITYSIAVWSVMTMLSAFATSFIHLFLARLGVGLGQAGSSPATHSLIADLFPPKRQTAAFAILGMAIHVGTFLAYTGGGWMAENFDWRVAMFIAGAPGVVVALLVWIFIPDPRGDSSLRDAFKPRTGEATLREAIAELSKKPAYWHLVAGGTVISFVGYGIGTFYPGFFVRVHGIGFEELGMKLGVVLLIFGVSGAWIGGRMSGYLNAKISGGSLLMAAVMILMSAPATLLAVHANQVNVAIILIGASTFGFAFIYSPCFSSMQQLASHRTQALATAIWLFFSTLIGLGLGSFVVGALSDFFSAGDPLAAGMGLRKAISFTCLLSIWAAGHFWFAQMNMKKDTNDSSQMADNQEQVICEQT